MDLIDNPWMRECAIALVLFLQAGAAFALAAHEPPPEQAAPGDPPGTQVAANDTDASATEEAMQAGGDAAG